MLDMLPWIVHVKEFILTSKWELSIRRTPKSFSRNPVDITLKQTISKDAASRHTGISAFTQCVKARKRWTVTRSMRGAVVSCLLDMAAITTKDETKQELKPHRIKRDNSDLEKLMKCQDDTMKLVCAGRHPVQTSGCSLNCPA